MIWRRYAQDGRFHAGTEQGDSFRTFCNGGWSLTDEKIDGSEHHPSPPHEERCSPCQRHAIEVRRIDLGLDELADAAPEWGGEA